MAIKAHDQITLTDVTDAYNVDLTKTGHTFTGGVDGAPSGSTCSTKAYALLGGTQCTVVNVAQANIICPDGIKAEVTANAGPNPVITFTTTKVISTDCEAIIPISVNDIIVNKTFSFSVSKAGASLTISEKSTTYQQGDSGTTAPTGAWYPTIPDVAAGKYLWSKTTVTYSDGNSTTSYGVSYIPHNGAGVTISEKSTTYQQGDSGTTAPTGAWGTSVPNVPEGKYLWTKTYVKYSDGNSTTSYSVSYNAVDGEPAIVVTISTNKGTVFKNSSGSTDLTAHVYVGGVEQRISDDGVCGSYGYIKWYTGASTTAIKTAKTYTVNASDVSSTLQITAQLEN